MYFRVLQEFFIHHNVPVTFLTFLLEGVESRHVLNWFIQCISSEISDIFISIHCLSTLAGYSRDTCIADAEAEFEKCCCDFTVFLNVSGCSPCDVSGLVPMRLSLILFSLCCLSSSHATTCRSAFSSPHPKLHRHIPAPPSTRALFLFFRAVSASLFVYDFILALPVEVISIIVLNRSRHSLVWFCRSSVQCQCHTTLTTSCVATSLRNSSFQLQSSAMEITFLLRQA